MPDWRAPLWSDGLARWRVTGCLPHLLTIIQLHPPVCRLYSHANGAFSESKSFSFSDTLDAKTLDGFIKGFVMLTLTGCLKWPNLTPPLLPFCFHFITSNFSTFQNWEISRAYSCCITYYFCYIIFSQFSILSYSNDFKVSFPNSSWTNLIPANHHLLQWNFRNYKCTRLMFVHVTVVTRGSWKSSSCRPTPS